jgi:hypothetical protein
VHDPIHRLEQGTGSVLDWKQASSSALDALGGLRLHGVIILLSREPPANVSLPDYIQLDQDPYGFSSQERCLLFNTVLQSRGVRPSLLNEPCLQASRDPLLLSLPLNPFQVRLAAYAVADSIPHREQEDLMIVQRCFLLFNVRYHAAQRVPGHSKAPLYDLVYQCIGDNHPALLPYLSKMVWFDHLGLSVRLLTDLCNIGLPLHDHRTIGQVKADLIALAPYGMIQLDPVDELLSFDPLLRLAVPSYLSSDESAYRIELNTLTDRLAVLLRPGFFAFVEEERLIVNGVQDFLRIVQQTAYYRRLSSSGAGTEVERRFVTQLVRLLDSSANWHLSGSRDTVRGKFCLEKALYIVRQAALQDPPQSELSTPMLVKRLCEIHPAMPQAYARILYTLGRLYLYTERVTERDGCRQRLQEAEQILLLTKHHANSTEYQYFDLLLARRSGLLCFELESNDSTIIEAAAAEYLVMMADREFYYDATKLEWLGDPAMQVGDLPLIQPALDYTHRLFCHYQLILAFLQLAKVNPTALNKCYDNALLHSLGGHQAGCHYDGELNLSKPAEQSRALTHLASILMLRPTEPPDSRVVDKLRFGGLELLPATVLFPACNMELSRILFQRARDTARRDVRTDIHAQACFGLAELQLACGEQEAAESSMFDALISFRKVRPDDHPDVVKCELLLARTKAAVVLPAHHNAF